MEQDARRAEPRTNGVLPRQTLQLFDAAQGLRDEPCPGLAAADTAVVRILRDSSVIPCGTLSMRKRVTEACGLGAAPGRLLTLKLEPIFSTSVNLGYFNLMERQPLGAPRSPSVAAEGELQL